MTNVKSFQVARLMKSNSNFMDGLIDVFKKDQTNPYQILILHLLEEFKERYAPVWHGSLSLNVGMDDDHFVVAQFHSVDRLVDDSEKLEIFKIQYKLTPTPVLIQLYEWEHIDAFMKSFTARHPDRVHGFSLFFYASVKWIFDHGFQPYLLNEEDGVIQMGFTTTSREEYFVITWNDNNLVKDLKRINGE